MPVETSRSERSKVMRALLRGLADVAPVVIAVVAMGGAFVVATKTVEGSLRDALLGAITGGFVTLIATLTAEEVRARVDRRRGAEVRAEEAQSVIQTIAHELLIASNALERMTDTPAPVYLSLLPDKVWDRLKVEFGRFYLDDVAKLALIYWGLAQMNQELRLLGAPVDGSPSTTAVTLPATIVGAMGDLNKEIDTGLIMLDTRRKRLQ